MSEDIVDVKEKALKVIEELTCNDDFAMSDNPKAKLLTKIYCFAHIANERCSNSHEDWKKELEEHYKHFYGEKYENC